MLCMRRGSCGTQRTEARSATATDDSLSWPRIIITPERLGGWRTLSGFNCLFHVLIPGLSLRSQPGAEISERLRRWNNSRFARNPRAEGCEGPALARDLQLHYASVNMRNPHLQTFFQRTAV